MASGPPDFRAGRVLRAADFRAFVFAVVAIESFPIE